MLHDHCWPLAALAATSRFRRSRRPPPRPDYSKPSTWLCLPGGATSARRRCRPPRSTPTATARSAEQRRHEPADRLLLRLSDGLARSGHEQRPQSPTRASGGDAGPVRALRQRLPAVRASVPPDDPGLGRRRCGRSERHRGRSSRLCATSCRLAHLSQQAQQGPAVRPHRPQPGLPDAPAADQAPDRGQADRRQDETGDPPRLQFPTCRRAGWSAAHSRGRRSAPRRARPAACSPGSASARTIRRRPAPCSACPASRE